MVRYRKTHELSTGPFSVAMLNYQRVPVWWYTNHPLVKNMSSLVGIMKFPMENKIRYHVPSCPKTPDKRSPSWLSLVSWGNTHTHYWMLLPFCVWCSPYLVRWWYDSVDDISVRDQHAWDEMVQWWHRANGWTFNKRGRGGRLSSLMKKQML